MCLGIPGRVVETYREHDVLMGKVQFGGVTKRVCLEHVPDARVEDYVLVHVGFALSRIDEDEARRVFEFLDSMNQLDELGPSDDGGSPEEFIAARDRNLDLDRGRNRGRSPDSTAPVVDPAPG